MYKRVCEGGLANESIFAIILHGLKLLGNVKNEISHATDWANMSSPTSPYVFKKGTSAEIQFINTFLEKNKYTMFLRKVDPSFPDDMLTEFIRRPAPASASDSVYFTSVVSILFTLFLVWLIVIVFYIQ